MKLVLLALLAIFASITTATPPEASDSELDQDSKTVQPSVEENQSMPKYSGHTPTVIDDAGAAFPPLNVSLTSSATGPRDTCLIDCNGDFLKAFVCWNYNNTRCFSCNLTSNDQSCLDQCRCITNNIAPTLNALSAAQSDSQDKDASQAPAPPSSSIQSSPNTKRSGRISRLAISGYPPENNCPSDQTGGLWHLDCPHPDVSSSCEQSGGCCSDMGTIAGVTDGSCHGCACRKPTGLLGADGEAAFGSTKSHEVAARNESDGSPRFGPECGNPKITVSCLGQGMRCDSSGRLDADETAVSDSCKYICHCKALVR